MNSKGFGWVLATCDGLLGLGYFTAVHWERALPAHDKLSSTAKSAALNNPLATLSLLGKMPGKEYDSSSNPGQLIQQALDSQDPQAQEEDVRSLLTDWSKRSPQSAARFVLNMPTRVWREKALLFLAQAWGEEGFDEALKWSAALPDQSERDTFLTNACLGVARQNLKRALQMALQNKDKEEGLVENLTQQWAEKEAPTALSWVLQQPPSQTRDQLLQRVVLVESKTNPVQAAGLVVKQMQPGSVQTEAVLTDVYQWAERDWNSAAAWVGEFLEGSLRDRAVTELNGMTQESLWK